MFTKLVHRLFGRSIEPLRLPRPAKPAAPQPFDFDAWQKRQGWRRSDLPQGRRARRIEIGDPPKAAPPFAPLTRAEFTTAASGTWASRNVAGVASAARPSLSRTPMARRPVSYQSLVARLR